jgi:beta-glucanase (GH16 family)
MYSKAFAIVALTQGIQAAERLILDEEFDHLNMTRWKHEMTMSGGGNWEFEMYVNNRTNSFVKEGVLHLQPTLAVDTLGEDVLRHGDVNIWGGSPADACTGNNFYGCERNAAASGNVINPIQSARIRTAESFSFKYGRMEIKAQLPKGDWLWPAIWLLPKDNAYGNWPASGEIDLVESRGNDASCEMGGRDSFGSTLHFGPNWQMDAWDKAHADYKHTADLSDDFHLYGMEWTEEGIKTTIDGKTVLDFKFDEDMWTKGGFDKSQFNPWQYETDKSAPFNQEYYIILNVAAGGTNDYWQEGKCGKPWSNTDPHSVNAFYNAKGAWFPTWNFPDSHDAAMKVDYIKVWQNDNAEEETFLQK